MLANGVFFSFMVLFSTIMAIVPIVIAIVIAIALWRIHKDVTAIHAILEKMQPQEPADQPIDAASPPEPL